MKNALTKNFWGKVVLKNLVKIFDGQLSTLRKYSQSQITCTYFKKESSYKKNLVKILFQYVEYIFLSKSIYVLQAPAMTMLLFLKYFWNNTNELLYRLIVNICDSTAADGSQHKKG